MLQSVYHDTIYNRHRVIKSNGNNYWCEIRTNKNIIIIISPISLLNDIYLDELILNTSFCYLKKVKWKVRDIDSKSLSCETKHLFNLKQQELNILNLTKFADLTHNLIFTEPDFTAERDGTNSEVSPWRLAYKTQCYKVPFRGIYWKNKKENSFTINPNDNISNN